MPPGPSTACLDSSKPPRPTSSSDLTRALARSCSTLPRKGRGAGPGGRFLPRFSPLSTERKMTAAKHRPRSRVAAAASSILAGRQVLAGSSLRVEDVPEKSEQLFLARGIRDGPAGDTPPRLGWSHRECGIL